MSMSYLEARVAKLEADLTEAHGRIGWAKGALEGAAESIDRIQDIRKDRANNSGAITWELQNTKRRLSLTMDGLNSDTPIMEA